MIEKKGSKSFDSNKIVQLVQHQILQNYTVLMLHHRSGTLKKHLLKNL